MSICLPKKRRIKEDFFYLYFKRFSKFLRHTALGCGALGHIERLRTAELVKEMTFGAFYFGALAFGAIIKVSISWSERILTNVTCCSGKAKCRP